MKNSALHDLNGLSVNGLREIIEAKTKLTQKLWIVVFLLCHGLTAFYIYRVIHEYLTSETSSKIKFEERDMYHFPNVVFCMSRWHNFTKMRETGLSQDAIRYGLSIFRQNHTVENVTAARDELAAFLVANNYSSLTAFFGNMSVFSRENAFVLQQMSDNRLLDNYIKSMTRDVQMRICANIKLGNVSQRHIKAWGEFGSKVVTLDVPDETYGTVADDAVYMIIYSQRNFEHDDTDPYVYLALSRSYHFNVIPKHFYFDNTNCVRHDEYRDTCMKNCWRKFADRVTHTGQCLGLYMIPVYEEVRRGPSAISTYCMGPVHNDATSEAFADASNYCNLPSQCMPYCEFEVFEISQSSGVLSPTNHPRQLEVVFRMNTEIGVLTTSGVTTYSFDTLVSNLGGVLGLWLGANMFTLIQLGALVWNYASVVYRTSRAKEVSRAEIGMKPKEDLGDAVASIYARLDSFEKTINQMQRQLTHRDTQVS